MAIKPSFYQDIGHQEFHIKVAEGSTYHIDALEVSPDLTDNVAPLEPGRVASHASVASMSELSLLSSSERYQRRKCLQAQDQLYHAHLVAARTARLLHTARSVQRTLAECIKAEDKHSFVNLFNAFHDTLADCSETTKVRGETALEDVENCVSYPASFVDGLPASSRTAILDFLSNVRQDGDFVADRLAALSHKELVSLLPDKGISRSTDSVFGSSPRMSSRMSKHLGYVADIQTDCLSSFECGSPLETLLLSVRDVSCTPLHLDSVAIDLWATVCARLISEQKPGSERFVPAVIDVFSSCCPWPGKERLGVWISSILESGYFLLEQPSKQSFRLRVQGQAEITAEDESRAEAFYESAVHSLLSLLADPAGASVIPEGVLLFCQAICQKLERSPSHRQVFPNFVLTRWLFSFLTDAITTPEIHGLLTDQYITDNARQRLLREIASRCQKSGFEVVYAWKHGNTASLEVSQLVRSLADRFQGWKSLTREPHLRSCTGKPSADAVIALTTADVTIIVNALYPQWRQPSFSSERDPSQTGLHSSASSTSGFSLFQKPSASEQLLNAAYDVTRGASLPYTTDIVPQTSAEHEPTIPSETLSSDLFDGQKLHEVCAEIEDSISSGALSGQRNWSVLIAHISDRSLRTACEILSDASGGCFSQASLGENKDLRICRTAIEELLVDDAVDASWHHAFGPGQRCDLSEIRNQLNRLFEERIASLEERSDFVRAHTWYRKFCCFQALVNTDNGTEILLSLLQSLRDVKQSSLSRTLGLSERCETSIRSVEPTLELCNKSVRNRADILARLRDKMWYVADVRTSATYEEARSVASALKVMGRPKKASRTRLAPSLRHWNGAKVPSTGFHLKSEAQVLEILSASPGHGGPNKLSDEQSKILSTWMENNAVENICEGEERLHRLCMEIRKAVEQVTADGSTTWSSALFAREQGPEFPHARKSNASPFWPLHGANDRFDLLTLQTNIPPSIDSISSASSHPLSARSSRDHFETRSPTLTNKSSASFWSPAMTEARSPSSATSVGSTQTHAAAGTATRRTGALPQLSSATLKEQLHQHATSLFLSDLAMSLFHSGSETDRAFWTGLGGELNEKYLRSAYASLGTPSSEERSSQRFGFDNAFEKLIRLFSSSCSPYAKLAYLLDIDTLLAAHVVEQAANAPPRRPELQQRDKRRHRPDLNDGPTVNDAKVDGFRRLFSKRNMRPLALYRDLQYIAALVPSSTIVTSSQGKAFWNATVAVLGLKQQARQIMVETADSIIAYHSNNRGHGRASSTAQQERDSATFTAPSRTPSAEDIAHYTMADAAYLLQITAKEGDAAAQRELATLYLTHPELMDHIIAPLSRPREVFKEELESKWRQNQDPARCDPATMCVAHHWMSLSSKGGDALAKEYLRQREEMDRLG
ncbi:hypothetical protein LTR37_020281 [Vermiconidia calcicola]|uniref:Uncharacterized protein n=1 Tax=Vermiconidia calcicola TaxID=1690605 RepID=A0ACC3MBP1_9PEZI|nr:hypothetical protein LTR37_020281 [Vermiconidia calcicola]